MKISIGGNVNLHDTGHAKCLVYVYLNLSITLIVLSLTLGVIYGATSASLISLCNRTSTMLRALLPSAVTYNVFHKAKVRLSNGLTAVRGVSGSPIHGLWYFSSPKGIMPRESPEAIAS